MLSHVLELTAVIGHEVLDPAGAPVGRLADLTVRLDGDAAPHRVRRLLVTRRRAPALLVPWQAVQALTAGRVVLRSDDIDAFAVAEPAAALDPDEILLVRDVLDTQIVDVVGQRLARVAEVVLARTRDGEIEVAGVEVGFAGVLRRLGLSRLVPGGRADMVAWSDLHLTSERGHAVQVSTPRAAVHRLDPRALAAVLSRVDTDAAGEILAAREPGVAAEALRSAHPGVAERVLRALPPRYAERIAAAMPAGHPGRWRGRPARHFLRSRVWAREHLNWPRR